MKLDESIIEQAIESYYHHSGVTVAEDYKKELHQQVQEISELMNYPGFRDLLIAQLLAIATNLQVIKNSHGDNHEV